MNISTDDGRMESSDGASFAAPLLSTVAAEAPLFVDVRGQPPSPESVEMMRNDADAVMDGSAVPAMSTSVTATGGWSVPDHNALLHRASEDRELADLLLAADAVTMDLNQPMTGLPPLSAPELKIMGRCVSFCAETSDTHNAKGQANDELIYYEGLVASLNLNTVVLMHVHRMTEMAYQLRQMESSGEVEHHTNHLVCGDGTSTTPASSNAPKVGTTSVVIHDEVASPQHIASAAEDLTALRSPPLTHTHEAAEGGDDGGGREASSGTMMEEAVFDAILAAPAKERNRLGSIHECGGPIPFMTFARSRIHDVIFARDPPSSFFSLFDDPSRHNFDLQCLRMYVRRYLVHCSQGNNPRQVSLRHFIENRCACAGRVEDELLMRIARQELRYLVKVARDMKKATDNRRAPRSVEELLLQYQAPPGLFQRTGILFLTNVPRQTFSVALIELSLVCAWLLYMGITYIAAEALFMLPYLEVLRNHTMTTAVMSTTTVCFTIYHSTVMRIPVDRFMAKLAMIRGMLLLITMLTCILFVVSATSSVMPSSVKDFLLHRGSTSGGRHNICAYYMRHSCSGFDTSCSYLTNEDERAALCSCASPIQQSFMSTCDAPMMITVQQTFVPMLCIGGILMMVLSLDLMLLGRFVLIARIVSMRLNAVRGSGETMV